MPGTRVWFAEGSGPDKLCYQVDCSEVGLRFLRIKCVQELQEARPLDDDPRRRLPVASG